MTNGYKWVYIAGLVDGEGSIYFSKIPRKYCTLQLCVKITNTYRPLIDWLEQELPYAYILTNYKNKKHRRNKTSWHIAMTRQKDIENFLEKILPYLIVKKEQAKLALIWTKKHIKYKKRYTRQRKRDPITGRYFETGSLVDRKWEEEIYMQMKTLNHTNGHGKKVIEG